MPSSLLGTVRTRARTRQGRRGGLNGLRPGATDAHTRSTQARRHYAPLCTAESMYIMRSMHEYLYIVMISSIFSVFSELIKNYERNKIDIWWRWLFERVHVAGVTAKHNVDLHGRIAADLLHLLLNKEIPHTNQLICATITHALLSQIKHLIR